MADITIFGAGIFGLSIAYACARRGTKVTVIDPHGPGAGSSGGIVGALAPHVPEKWSGKKAFQFDALIKAAAFWAEVETIASRPTGYKRTGRLQPIATPSALDLAQTRAANAENLWQGLAEWRIEPAANFGALAPLSPTGFVIHDTLTARLHPRMACAALAAAITALGGTICQTAPAKGKIVHATGAAGLVQISQDLGKPFGAGEKGQAALLAYAAPDAPQIYTDNIHIIPHADGTTAIGSTSERYFDDLGTDDALDALIARAQTCLPALHGAPVLERWSGLRPRTHSRAPVVGAHPLYPDQFIANGGFKIGFAMGPAIGAMMADLLLDEKNTIPPEFNPATCL